jgi:DNA-binding NarL/FixJ family response regulator
VPRPPSAQVSYLYASPFRPPKLTGEQRDDITRRLAEGAKPADLATEFGVTASTIRTYR